MAIKSFDQLSVEFDENEVETPDDSNNQLEKPFHEIHTFDKRRKAIVLITMYRAGSTFFGELFNQNPEIFYHFEPLTLFGYDKPNMEHKLRMLKEIIVDCRSPKYSEYSEFVSFKKMNQFCWRMCYCDVCDSKYDCHPQCGFHMMCSRVINLTPQGQLSLRETFGVWTDVKVLWTKADEGEVGM